MQQKQEENTKFIDFTKRWKLRLRHVFKENHLCKLVFRAQFICYLLRVRLLEVQSFDFCFWRILICKENKFTFQSSMSIRSAVASSRNMTSQSLFIIALLNWRCFVIFPIRWAGTIPLIGAKRLVLPLSALPIKHGT